MIEGVSLQEYAESALNQNGSPNMIDRVPLLI